MFYFQFRFLNVKFKRVGEKLSWNDHLRTIFLKTKDGHECKVVSTFIIEADSFNQRFSNKSRKKHKLKTQVPFSMEAEKTLSVYLQTMQ